MPGNYGRKGAVMNFMTGRFQHIILLNYKIDPEVLIPYLPPYTEPDLHNGGSFISLVGLQALDLRILGIPLPLQQHYAQVNLRFYVRRRAGRTAWRHGVVFIRQIVPHRLLAWGARLLFNETMAVQRVNGRIDKTAQEAEMVEYGWLFKKRRHYIRAAFRREPGSLVPASDKDFFVERYWGYTLQKDGGCREYPFNHPPWETYRSTPEDTAAEVGDFYGTPFTEILGGPPDSGLVCLGSPVSLGQGRRL